MLRDGYESPTDILTLLPKIQRSHKIFCDNVTRYLYEESDQEVWEWSTDFPCISTPFDSLWMESSAPRFSLSGKKVLETPTRYQMGAFCVTHQKAETGLVPTPSEARWVQEWLVFSDTDGLPRLIGGRIVFVGELGEAVSVDTWPMLVPAYVRDSIGDDGATEVIDGLLRPFMLSLCFVNCRNTELVKKRLISQNGQIASRKSPPIYKYYVLQIDPIKRILEVEGASKTKGLRKALHICRGHFKDYREKGLFGQHHDIYWWGSHVRGSLDSGRIEKDYAV
jgi:hypothetical protein